MIPNSLANYDMDNLEDEIYATEESVFDWRNEFWDKANNGTLIGDYIWASEYVDGKKSSYKINDAYATFQWGWNFEFVPRITSGKRIAWARTDKSVYSHIFEVSEDFSGYDSTGRMQSTKKFQQNNFKNLFYRLTNKKQTARVKYSAALLRCKFNVLWLAVGYLTENCGYRTILNEPFVDKTVKMSLKLYL